MDNSRWLVAFSLLLVSGYFATQVAADEEQTTPNSVELAVDFSFEEKHRCSRISPEIKEISIPSVPGHSFDLPEGFFIVSPHQAPSWDKAGAYMTPCSGGRGNTYYVTVNAVHQSTPESKEFKLLGQAALEHGKY